jgi:hypothetical protein
VGIAMGDDGAMFGKLRGVQARATLLEEFQETVAIGGAVDAPAPLGEIAPGEDRAGETELPIEIEAADATAEPAPPGPPRSCPGRTLD